MTVDESTRLQVLEAFRESHGERIASALIEMLPPAGVPDLATKDDVALVRRDLAALEQHVDDRFETFERRFDEFEQRIDERLGAFEQRIDERLGAFEQRIELRLAGSEDRTDVKIAGLDVRISGLDVRISGLEAKLERELRAQGNRFIGWMFAGLATFGVATELAGRIL